jgi:hypothetical protein
MEKSILNSGLYATIVKTRWFSLILDLTCIEKEAPYIGNWNILGVI